MAAGTVLYHVVYLWAKLPSTNIQSVGPLPSSWNFWQTQFDFEMADLVGLIFYFFWARCFIFTRLLYGRDGHLSLWTSCLTPSSSLSTLWEPVASKTHDPSLPASDSFLTACLMRSGFFKAACYLLIVFAKPSPEISSAPNTEHQALLRWIWCSFAKGL